ncbi:S-layer homology domain-containing protein [Paenibacillus sp. N3.4]|uniref:S-layer homology domain-containing protein n=1 Tax=Paenibacillus sp. N3.4 TaxID=2603222 RepID=UPI0011CC6AC4|nr:S-layer homology domain-containing protein [Paenibacillus sp. N3.4]TXK76766.1 hypothetical protein FU659_24780 [Paenibacillus sp. N3.4]
MGAAKKLLLLFFACILFLSVLLPMPITYAEAHVTKFAIQDASSDLIAGKEYLAMLETDRANGTFIGVEYNYSTDGGATWIGSSIFLNQQDSINSSFVLPIDRQLTSAMFRVRVDFTPTFGKDSHSEKTIGPYKILQPGSPSDVVAVANKDNSVTLTWNDNSNMETYYTIFRDGPDGSKPFYVTNTKDHLGLLSYVDKTTNPTESIIYAYSLYTVIDQYALPDNIKPGPVSVLVKTKQLAPKITDPIKNNTDLFKLSDPQKTITDSPKGLLSDKYAAKLSQYILDVDNVAVKSVELNKKSLALNKGESQTLNAAISPSNAVKQQVTWSSDNPKVATVDSAGKVTGISAGTAIIKAMTADGLTSICVVRVTEDPQANEPTPTPATPKPKATSAPTPTMPKTDFTDIAGHWAYEDITQAVELGFVNGYPDGTFRPDGSVTRAEFANMLMNGIKPTTEGAELLFKDKDKIGAWALQSVSKAFKLGIISGYSDGTFQPSANITHAEMIAMIVRASGLPMDNTQPTGYADDADIPKWAKPAAKTAELNGIIIVSGITGKAFAPQTLSTRAEATSAIVKMLKIGK